MMLVEDNQQISVKLAGIVQEVQGRLRWPGSRRKEVKTPTNVFVVEDAPPAKGRKRFLIFGRRRTVTTANDTLALSKSNSQMLIPAKTFQKSHTGNNAMAGAAAGIMVRGLYRFI
eukprot:926395-Prorocentrum_minimum.AAC.6